MGTGTDTSGDGDAVLLSACVIARDEADRIARCVASVSGAVDEVVVYDTGSTDATAALAAAAGARVVTGTWPGGFAEARNAATAHCRGEWVLSIDADEQLVCPDPAALRDRLRATPEGVLALQVSIHNLTGSGRGSGYRHTADRVFRRRSCRWKGRLHEQLVSAADGSFPPVQALRGARLDHDGYLHELELDRGKAARNLELARAEVEDPSFGDRGLALVWLGRALWAADRPEEALGHLVKGAGTTANPRSRRQGLEAAARIALRLDRLGQAEELIGRLRAASTEAVVADLLEAALCLARNLPEQALLLLERTGATAGPVSDDDGRGYTPEQLLEWRASALVGAGRPGAAADVILGSWKATGRLDADLDLLVEALERADRSLDEIADTVDGPSLPAAVASSLRLDPPRAGRVLDGLWRSFGDRPGDGAVTVLAGAALLGRVLDPPAAAVWSERLRRQGLNGLCPLRAVASDPAVPPGRRLEAAAELAGRFGEHPPAVEAGAEPRVSWKKRPAGPPDFSLVLLARGGAERVLACLQTLAPTLPPEMTFEVIAVDTGSVDATSMLLGSLDGEVAVVRTELDVGAVRARNLGWAQAGGPVVVFVDAGARPEHGWLEPLLAVLDGDRRVGAAGPVLVGPDGTVVSAGATVDPDREDRVPAAGLARRPWGTPPRGPYVEWLGTDLGGSPAGDGPRRVDALAGTVVAVRRSDLQAAGGFDEGYWEGGETVDLCFSLAAAGRSVVCVPASRVSLPDAPGSGPDPWSAAGTGVPVLPARFEDSAGPVLQHRANRLRFATRWGPPG